MELARALRIRPKEIIAVAGGGGKTALMFRLAGELSAAGVGVVTTMTTRIFASQMALAPASILVQDDETLPRELPGMLSRHGHVLVAGSVAVEADKVAGIPPELVGRIARLNGVGALIVEADGSRRLPLKAPAPHEPVIPPDASIVIPMAGIDVIGRPLESGAVHRPELVAALAGAALGDPVTPAMVAAVLTHPDGGARHAPPASRLVPFINKVEDDAGLAAGREIARVALEKSRVDSVVLGAVQRPDPVREVWSRVGVVVLAAGQAARFGALKQVLPWRGLPLVAHVAAQALSCRDVDRVVVTVGAGAEQVEAALAGLPVDLVRVPDWAGGQSRSVQAGLAAFAGPSSAPVGAVLFLLADQPGVSPKLLAALIARHRVTLAPIVAPRYGDRRGNPVLFDRSTFAEFDGLRGDIGARPILNAHAGSIAWLDWPSPEITHDIDTAADYDPGTFDA